MSATPPPPSAERHAIVELLGRVRFGARVEEREFLGTKMLACVVLTSPPFERLVAPAALYSLTFCSEGEAVRVNSRWTMPQEMRPQLGPGDVIDTDEDTDDTSGHCASCGALETEPCLPGCSQAEGGLDASAPF